MQSIVAYLPGRMLEDAYRTGRERREELRRHRDRPTAAPGRDSALQSRAPTTRC